MNCPYYIYDTEEEVFLSSHFATFEGAEDYIENNCGGNYEQYEIFKKLS